VTQPIRIRARHQDGKTEVLILMPHPMETGLRKGDAGAVVPAHYITDVVVKAGERVVLEAQLSIAVSKDPLLSFRFRGGEPGDRIQVTWTDNMGMTRTDEAQVG